MSKPDDIPQDVWDAAAIGVDYYSRRQEHVARAVLAERERCAVKADRYADRESGRVIAKAIREGV